MNLTYDRLLSNFAFNCNLRHYTAAVDAAAAAAAAVGGSPVEADGKVQLVHMLLKEGAEASEVVRARTVWTPKTSSSTSDWELALAAFEGCSV